MRVAIIGRSEILFNTAKMFLEKGYCIPLIITAKEAPEYTKTSKDFYNLAISIGAKFIQTPHIHEVLKDISDLSEIDIAVSYNYVGIIPQKIINLFRLGILNAHGGDLPRYRGNACQAWAILNGEKQIGLCIHKMVGGELDSGDIVARDYFPVKVNTKITEVHHWLCEKIPILFDGAVNRLFREPNYVLEIQSKKIDDALRCYPRKPEDGQICWDDTALQILRLINACNKPYTGAFCKLEEKKLIIWDAELVEKDENFIAVPGQVTSIERNFIEIACGEGKLRIIKIEINGRVNKPFNYIKSIRVRLS